MNNYIVRIEQPGLVAYVEQTPRGYRLMVCRDDGPRWSDSSTLFPDYDSASRALTEAAKTPNSSLRGP